MSSKTTPTIESPHDNRNQMRVASSINDDEPPTSNTNIRFTSSTATYMHNDDNQSQTDASETPPLSPFDLKFTTLNSFLLSIPSSMLDFELREERSLLQESLTNFETTKLKTLSPKENPNNRHPDSKQILRCLSTAESEFSNTVDTTNIMSAATPPSSSSNNISSHPSTGGVSPQLTSQRSAINTNKNGKKKKKKFTKGYTLQALHSVVSLPPNLEIEPLKKYLLRSSTTIHTKPENLLLELINPKSKSHDSIKMKHSKWPSPQVIMSNNEDMLVDGSINRLVYAISYRQSADDEDELLEFIHCYTVLKLDDGNFMISFLTVMPDDLPIETEELEFIRNSVDEQYTIASGWMEMGNYYLRKEKYDQTELILNFIINVSPTNLVRVPSYFMMCTEFMANARKLFDRSLQVDEAVNSHFINEVMPTLTTLTTNEIDIIQECKTLLNWEKKEETKWTRMPGSKNERIEKFQIENNDKTVTVKGVAKIDESAEQVLSYLLHFASNERLNIHIKGNGNTKRSGDVDYKSHTSHFINEVRSPKLIANRWFAGRMVWQKGWEGNPNAYVIALLSDKADAALASINSTPVNAEVDTSISGFVSGVLQSTGISKLITSATTTNNNTIQTMVVASTIAIYVIEPLSERVTRVTLFQKTDLQIGASKLGKIISNYAAQYSLSILEELRVKYERKGSLIDSELRLSFIDKISSVPALNGDQMKLVKRCLELDDVHHGEFTEIVSNSHRTKYYQKYDPSVKGNVFIGKAVTVIDTSAEQALACRWDICSNEKMQLHREDNTSVSRFVVKETSSNESIVSIARTLPFPFKSREFVAKSVWSGPNLEDGSYLYCWESTNDPLSNSSHVRATVTGFMKFRPIVGSSRSEFTTIQKIATGGNIPAWVANMKIMHSLSAPSELHDVFDRDDDIDLEESTRLAEFMANSDEGKYEIGETNSIEVVKSLAKIAKTKLQDIKSPNEFVEMKIAAAEGVGFAEVILDSTIEEAATDDYLSYSRKKYKEFYNDGGIVRDVFINNNHRHINRSVVDFKIPFVSHREFMSTTIWEKESPDQIIVISEPIANVKPEWKFPTCPNDVMIASAWHLSIIKRLPDIGGVPQTQMMWYCHYNLNGKIPVSVINKKLPERLMSLERLRKTYDKSLEVDSRRRDAFVRRMKRVQNYTTDEKLQIDDALSRLKSFDSLLNKKKVKSASRLAKSEIAYKEGDRHAFGKASAIIRASPQQIIAYQWDFMARDRRKKDTIKKVIKDHNGHNKLVYMVKVMPGRLSNRDLVMRFLWEKLDTKGINYVFAIVPESHEDYPEEDKRAHARTSSFFGRTKSFTKRLVRARYPATMKLTRSRSYETNVDYLMQLDLGGNDHAGLVTYFVNLYLAKQLKRVVAMQQYFQKLRPLNLLDENDGEAIGMLFGDQREKERQRAGWFGDHVKQSVAIVMKENKSMQEISKIYPWFSDLMEGILDNRIYMFPPSVKSNVLNMSKMEAYIIGRKLSKQLKAKKTAEAVVDQWMVLHPGIMQLDKEFPFCTPMCVVIGRQKVVDAVWGMRYRMYIGASLSILDLSTDLFTIVIFFKQGNYNFALINLAFIGVSLCLQLLFVYAQNKKRGMHVIVYESMTVVLAIKPAVDARRIALGNISLENCLVSPQNEATCIKAVEIFGESIPSSVLQTYAILGSDTVTAASLFSIFISACTIAYASISMSIDWDTDPENRAKNSAQYGYIGDTTRLQIMIFMMVFTVSHVIMKVLACSLFLRLSKLWFCLYICGDMIMFWSYKIARGDFRYWSNVSTKLSWVTSFVARTVVKEITDFTLLVQFRHPNELGGLYWSFTMVQNQIFCFVSVYLYNRVAHNGSTIEVEGGAIINVSDEVLPILVVVLFIFSVIGFISFLLSINKQYLCTFTDIRTGKEFTSDTWLNGTHDKERFCVFENHKSYYKSINKEIKIWLTANWGEWEEQKEDWFTPKNINKIPVELLPAEALKKKNGGVRKTVRGTNTIRVGKLVKADEGGVAALSLRARMKTILLSPKTKGDSRIAPKV